MFRCVYSVSLCCSVYCLCVNVYCTVLYCTLLYCTVLHCTVLYCTVLYSTVLYCKAYKCPKHVEHIIRCNKVHTETSSWFFFSTHRQRYTDKHTSSSDVKCLQRGTDWVFKYSGLRFACKGLIFMCFVFI